MMDDSMRMSPNFWMAMTRPETGEVEHQNCDLCGELLQGDENVFLTTTMQSHTECRILAAMGDVAHLEGRCVCGDRDGYYTTEELAQTYREESLACVEWLVKHGRGRWADD